MNKYIYIGPNSRKYGLMRNAVYDESIPGFVLKAIAEVPEVSLLVVTVESMTEKLEKVKRKGTPEYRAYEVVAGLKG